MNFLLQEDLPRLVIQSLIQILEGACQLCFMPRRLLKILFLKNMVNFALLMVGFLLKDGGEALVLSVENTSVSCSNAPWSLARS